MTYKKNHLYVGRELAIDTCCVDNDVKITINGLLLEMSATLSVRQAQMLVAQLNNAITLAKIGEADNGNL